MIKLGKISIKELTDQKICRFLDELETLTHGKDGYMKYHLQACRIFAHKNDFTADVFVVCEEDDKTILGWALCQDLTYRNEDYKELSIFIDPDERGAGHGGTLIKYVLDNTDYKISCWASEGESREKFFKKYANERLNLFDMDHYMEEGEFKLL